MDPQTIFLPAKPRVPRKRRVGSPSTTTAALHVIGVENVNYDEPVLAFTLVFNTTADEPLVAATLDPDKWSAVFQGGSFSGLSADVVAFDRIDVTAQGTAGPGGPSTVSYSNDPSDVSDTSGRTLAAFDDLPL